MSLQNMFGNLALDATVQGLLLRTIGAPQFLYETQDVVPLATVTLASYIATANEKLAYVCVTGDGDADVTVTVDSSVVWKGYIARSQPNIQTILGVNVPSGKTVAINLTCNAINTSTFNATILHG